MHASILGRGYLSVMVAILSWRMSTQQRRQPLDFFTITSLLPHSDDSDGSSLASERSWLVRVMPSRTYLDGAATAGGTVIGFRRLSGSARSRYTPGRSLLWRRRWRISEVCRPKCHNKWRGWSETRPPATAGGGLFRLTSTNRRCWVEPFRAPRRIRGPKVASHSWPTPVQLALTASLS